MSRTHRLGTVVCLLVLGLPGPAPARDLFTARISIGGGTPAQRGTNKARHLPDLLDESTLLAIDPGYDPSEAVAGALDLRGLAADASFDAFSNTLRLQVPGAGIDVSFSGASRDEALANLEDWLEGDYASGLAPEQAVTRLLQALVAHSPVDPVAGNPNSLQSRMFDADWRAGTDGPIGPDHFGLNLGGGFYQGGDYDVAAIDLPIRARFGLGERVALMLDLPMVFTSTQGAWSGMGSAGLGVEVKPFSWWSLTPAARIGGVGSLDLGGLAAVYSGTLTSQLRIPLGPLVLGVGNMGGVAKTIDGIRVAGYAIEYDLTNWTMRNGGYLEIALGGERLAGLGLRLHASDVRFFGDELFLDAYQEVGAALAGGLPIGGLSLGVAYLIGDDYSGVGARAGLRF